MLVDQIMDYQKRLLNVETSEHIHNVASMVIFLASKMCKNISDEKLLHLHTMALFHDIGKINIPLEILERDGPLTDGEYELIKQHPKYGKDILHDFGFTDEEIEIVYQHHEKPDGSGYPRGLKNDEIMMEAHILSSIDILDALLSDRAYKRGWEPEKVKEFFIKNEEGLHQAVVDNIIEHFDELLKLRKE
jgi:putative nucleotidyltransferase with HDIG domain